MNTQIVQRVIDDAGDTVKSQATNNERHTLRIMTTALHAFRMFHEVVLSLCLRCVSGMLSCSDMARQILLRFLSPTKQLAKSAKSGW